MVMRPPSCAVDQAAWDCLAAAAKKPRVAPQQSCNCSRAQLTHGNLLNRRTLFVHDKPKEKVKTAE